MPLPIESSAGEASAGPQRGQLGDTLIFIFISISFHAVPFLVSDTALA